MSCSQFLTFSSCKCQLLLFSVLAACFAGLLPILQSAQAETQSGSDEFPNIVIILADDMGFGDVRAVNRQSRIPTPHLDSLAKQGMTFHDAHSPSGVCTPTRYGLLTGRYCWRSRMKSGVLGGYSKPLLESGRTTIASLLKSRGYRTGAVGKWHLGMEMPLLKDDAKISNWAGDPGIDFGGVIADSPIDHGFDYYFGVSASLDMAPFVYIRNDRFTMLPTLQQPAVKFPHFVRQGPRAEDFVIDLVLDRLTEEAVEFVGNAAKGERPFFLYLPLTAPHKPTQPKAEFKGMTKLGEYGDFIAQVDDAVGQVLQAIDDAGVRDNTLVVFTSDNGSYMFRYDDAERGDHVDDDTIQGYRAENHRANGPWRGTKADIYEGGHRVPFFVRWPGQIQPASNCYQPICHVDLFATCAEVSGEKPKSDEAEDSFSILGMLRGEETGRGAPVIHHSASGMFAIRDGKWKLILGNGSGGREKPKGKSFEKPYQLYDMISDPAEQSNVIERHPDVAAALTTKLEEIRDSGSSR